MDKTKSEKLALVVIGTLTMGVLTTLLSATMVGISPFAVFIVGITAWGVIFLAMYAVTDILVEVVGDI